MSGCTVTEKKDRTRGKNSARVSYPLGQSCVSRCTHSTQRHSLSHQGHLTTQVGFSFLPHTPAEEREASVQKSVIELAAFFFFFQSKKTSLLKKDGSFDFPDCTLQASLLTRIASKEKSPTAASPAFGSCPPLPGMHPPRYLPNSINIQSRSEQLLQAGSLQKIISPASGKHGFSGNTRCVTLSAVVGSRLSSRDWLSMPATSAWRARFYIATVRWIIKHHPFINPFSIPAAIGRSRGTSLTSQQWIIKQMK